MLELFCRVTLLKALLPFLLAFLPAPMLINSGSEELHAREAHVTVDEVFRAICPPPGLRLTTRRGFVPRRNSQSTTPRPHAGRPPQGHRWANGLTAPYRC